MKIPHLFKLPSRSPTYCRRCDHSAPDHGYDEQQDPRVGKCQKCHCWGYYGEDYIARRTEEDHPGQREREIALGLSDEDYERAQKSYKPPRR